ncbi:hypothetical protein GCM10022244_18980 [Streptomyces gulbargensis]|uniref:Uncharacterized protein n=1 Tax=Streptomyces gulbargensis TaxID=364901 RepID=A0ABP7LWQ2_9ACTN
MDADEVAVGGEPDVALQGVGAVLDRLHIGGQGVFRCVLGRPAVGDDLDGGAVRLLPCVSHRVMVPLAERPERETPVLSVYKGGSVDAQLRLTAV